MIGAAVAKGIEVTAKEGVKEIAKETRKEFAKKDIDISKRIDVTKKTEIKDNNTSVDISKRIKFDDSFDTFKELKNKDLSEILKDYLSDLKSKSEVADTINEKALDPSKLKETPTEEVKKLREEFDDNKAKLRSDWEKLNNQEWPRYDHDVYNKDGVRIRKPGDCYDAHHVQPLSLGEKNEASNLTPLELNNHKDIHSINGSCTKMVDKVTGGNHE